ncbi:thioredoxin family protein [Paractinoplanes atraurantiacus]|uniref:Thioredoxin n=1 Tax=Paractinoplanes atraurantiacus TaxID=1036182 RepID=A0A285K965_9ACTN|nr:thioredoxin domain-containing protein [Actinoplanes atraurantiacus]SNY67861.1 thioredoxin 1 [Actinoplanes atraurantiacus]
MPDHHLPALTDATFAETIRTATTPVVVDVWAEWCPPCGPMARTLAELAPEFDGRLRIYTLNADENPETARAHRIMSLPTLLVYDNGTLISATVGARPKSVLRLLLANTLTPYANV